MVFRSVYLLYVPWLSKWKSEGTAVPDSIFFVPVRIEPIKCPALKVSTLSLFPTGTLQLEKEIVKAFNQINWGDRLNLISQHICLIHGFSCKYRMRTLEKNYHHRNWQLKWLTI